ncbi:hypothetical protein E6C50_16325 [Flavobacterium supellecticarium]|uniref:O-antigen ligase n=1 Tax=Flavobacterium supellecticarium TaxID=2565924 RepID=A0A4S3ZQ27_9FLAO|nr:O-antigen ligase family protein [Flavobacterium supellecticarium]THF47643.1 hypothetical protein E6C50_16325 [Flavobacterium supellecticarium]
MLTIKNYLNQSYDYLLIALILILPFSKGLPNVILGLLALVFILDYKKKYFQEYFQSPLPYLAVLILYVSGQALINGTFMLDLNIYKKYFYLILLPILFFKINNIQRFKILSLIAINASIIGCLFRIFKFYSKFKFFPFADGWTTNFVLLQERPYMGVFCVIGIILAFEQLHKKNKGKYFYLFSILFSLAFILFITVRMAMITVLVLFIIYLFGYLKSNTIRKRLILAGFILFLGTVFMLNKNISKRFFINSTLEKTIENIKQSEPRVIIFGCSGKIVQQDDFSFLFGFDSYTKISERLVACYDDSIEDYSRKSWFLESKFNSHCQFIDFYLIGGIIGLLLFVTFIIKTFLYSYKDFFAMAVFAAFVMFLIVENVFYRQFGCYIFSIFVSLYIINVSRIDGKS